MRAKSSKTRELKHHSGGRQSKARKRGQGKAPAWPTTGRGQEREGDEARAGLSAPERSQEPGPAGAWTRRPEAHPELPVPQVQGPPRLRQQAPPVQQGPCHWKTEAGPGARPVWPLTDRRPRRARAGLTAERVRARPRAAGSKCTSEPALCRRGPLGKQGVRSAWGANR